MESLIIDCIKSGISLNKLASVTGKSELEVGYIIKELRDKGFCIDSFYNGKGIITYSIDKEVSNSELSIDVIDNELRAVIISDLHIGYGNNDGLNCIKDIYEYAIKNDIHIIFILGDLINGINSKTIDTYSTISEQVGSFMEKYPYQSDILNFILLGNHDYSALDECGYDITRTLERRSDVINLGYGIGRVNLQKSVIGFKHDLVVTKPPEKLTECAMIFKGHHHRCEVFSNNIIVPALLNETFIQGILSTGFLDATFSFDNELLDNLRIKHLNFIPGIKVVNDINISKLSSKIKKKI